MSEDRQPVVHSAGEPLGSPPFHVRTIVLQPRGPLGKLLLAAALVGAGVLFVTVGVALAATLAAAAVVTGAGVIAYRALGGAPRGAPRGARLEPPLDPRKEIRPGPPER